MEEEKRKIPCSVFSRVVGYLQPVDGWNIGKREEFRLRKTLDLGKYKNELSGDNH